MDDLVIDSVQFVCPLVLVHSVFAPASDPNGFFQPACGFVRFLINNSGGVPIDDMVVGRDMLSINGRFENLRRWCFPLWSGEIFGTLFFCFFLVFWKSSFENATCFTVGFGATFAWNFHTPSEFMTSSQSLKVASHKLINTIKWTRPWQELKYFEWVLHLIFLDLKMRTFLFYWLLEQSWWTWYKKKLFFLIAKIYFTIIILRLLMSSL